MLFNQRRVFVCAVREGKLEPSSNFGLRTATKHQNAAGGLRICEQMVPHTSPAYTKPPDD